MTSRRTRANNQAQRPMTQRPQRVGTTMLSLSVIVAGAVAWAVAGASAHVAHSGCTGRPPASGRQTVTVQDPVIGRTTRTYQLYVPRNYDSSQRTAVVLDFHGYYDTGAIQEEQSGFKQIGDEYNFIIAWPNGLDDTVVGGFDAYSWNAVGTVESPGPSGDTCKWAKEGVNNGYPCHSSCKATRGCRTDRRSSTCDCSTCADDIVFVTAILDQLEATLCIDTSRVFAAGMSNGAMMTYALAQSSIASRFAAISPVAGSPLVGFGAKPYVAMPILEIHGSRDDIIPANTSGSYRGEIGPDGSTVSSDGFYYEPVDRTMARFAAANGCEGDSGWRHYPTKFDGLTSLYCVEPFGRCNTAGPTVRCTFAGGHTWPFGNGAASRRSYALMVWEFFTNAAVRGAAAAARLDVKDVAAVL